MSRYGHYHQTPNRRFETSYPLEEDGDGDDDDNDDDDDGPPQFLFRAFHSESGGQENSRNGFRAGRTRGLNRGNYAAALHSHFDLSNREPTYWVSTTSDLLRAINIACNWQKQSKTGVSIAVIDVNRCEKKPKSGKELTSNNGLGKRMAVLRRTEWLFQYEILRNEIVACLSLQTLVSRQLYNLVPELDLRNSRWRGHGGDVPIDEMREAVRDAPPATGGQGFWTNMGTKGAEVALLFGLGEHTEYIAGEAVDWWLEDELQEYQRGYIKKAITGTINQQRTPMACFG